MKASHAMISGAMIGVLAAIVICTIQGITWSDTLYRALILGGAGGWMGMLLAWLNQMLTPKKPIKRPDDQPENRV